MATQDDSEVDRRERTLREEDWQILAAPLFCVREIRELVAFCVANLDGASERESELLDTVTRLESRLLRRCLRADRQRTMDELRLDRLRSWKEVVTFLRASDDAVMATQLDNLLPAARRLCEKLRPDLE